jgi:hypothetical protein
MSKGQRLAAKIMKQTIAILAVTALAGCEYQTRLVSTPEQKIDESLLGTWKRQGGDAKIQVLKLSDYRYFAVCGSDAGITTPCPVDDIPIFQTEFIVPLTDGTKKVKYELMYWRAQRDGDALKVAHLNARLVPYDTPTVAELHAAIRKHKRDRKLFEEEATFMKTDEQPDATALDGAKLALPFLEQKWKGQEPDWEEVMKAYTRQQRRP